MRFFNTMLGLSMLLDKDFSVRTISAEEAADFVRYGFENVANPTHFNSLQAITQKLGVDVLEARGNHGIFKSGDICLVARVSGIPRETREFSDEEIAAAEFVFRLVEIK